MANVQMRRKLCAKLIKMSSLNAKCRRVVGLGLFESWRSILFFYLKNLGSKRVEVRELKYESGSKRVEVREWK